MRRLGGADKPGLPVGGRPLVDRVLDACADAATTVVVGGRRPTPRPVTWAREDPPGGGPLAALEAGLRHVTADRVLVLSADLPFLDRTTVRTLLAGLDGAQPAVDRSPGHAGPRPLPPHPEAVLVRDRTGRDQPLVAAYATEPLRRELALLATEYGTVTGLPLRLLTAELALARVDGADAAAFDCDTWEDLAAARARIREHGNVLDEWITAVKTELGIDVTVDIPELLDLARDAAHGVARPAAPLTTFLVGYAAALAAADGADPKAALTEACRKAADLATRWEAETGPAGGPAGG
ncbi:DUF6457 domain-containing protein [Streptomyces sp. NRRL S-87]|uniref:DUF6457 domain-containing protein n=1 Tax=Streptomyces sp. NRRL S-87 TaxID=1463920 RepID=UPI00068EB787|nr:DUF6457 domain-containing protein [Streptomyces sp. NRRL S-87]